MRDGIFVHPLKNKLYIYLYIITKSILLNKDYTYLKHNIHYIQSVIHYASFIYCFLFYIFLEYLNKTVHLIKQEVE